MSLASKIDSGSALIGVIGLGYVGLPLLSAFCHAGFKVLGVDVDRHKITDLKAGKNYLNHLGNELAADLIKTGRFDATADMSRLHECDVLIVCVPTPLGPHLEPDLHFIRKTADDIGKVLRPGQLIVL
jgi:UDP-N-acetyl-D-glucosamine dehydrogenase